MADHEPFAGIAQESTLSNLSIDIDDIYVRALLRKLMQLKYDGASQLAVSLTGLPTLSTVTTVGTVGTGNMGIGDAGKPVSYQQISAISGSQSRRCFTWE